jgi:hypothetical protein
MTVSRLRAWWAGFGWTRLDAAFYGAIATAGGCAAAGQATGWGWLSAAAWVILTGLACVSVWYWARIMLLLNRRRRRKADRRAAK